MITADEVSREGCKKIQSSEVFDLPVGGVNKKNHFSHLTSLACSLYSVSTPRIASEGLFCVAVPVAEDQRACLQCRTI